VDGPRPSRTALRVALRRAAHQLYDDPPLVLNDPFALPILGHHAEEIVRTPGRNPENKPRPYSIGLRAFLVARSRYAEDLLADAVAQGTTQYVLLGAGLDTFAHRNPFPSLRVFEVDHPHTQQWKRELLLENRLAHAAHLTYVPVDFERDSLRDRLIASGFDPHAPTFFAWLGVVPYLTPEAFRATVKFLSTQPSGSGIVLDYSQPRAVLEPEEQLAHDSLASRVRQAGEAFRQFFTPTEMAAEFPSFCRLQDIGSPEINARYFADRTDNLRTIGDAGRFFSAWIP